MGPYLHCHSPGLVLLSRDLAGEPPCFTSFTESAIIQVQKSVGKMVALAPQGAGEESPDTRSVNNGAIVAANSRRPQG